MGRSKRYETQFITAVCFVKEENDTPMFYIGISKQTTITECRQTVFEAWGLFHETVRFISVKRATIIIIILNVSFH